MLLPPLQPANSTNARSSTGPRTEAGKARSSQNARKHGLTAAQLVIAPEDREEFDELLAALQADVKPQGALQQILFQQLLESAWNLRRVRSMESELAGSEESYLDPELDRLARHKTRIERAFHRSLRELKALQTDAALAPTLPVNLKYQAHPLASTTQIAKRTQALAIGDRKNGVEEYWSGADAEAEAIQCALVNHVRNQDNNHEPPKTVAAGS